MWRFRREFRAGCPDMGRLPHPTRPAWDIWDEESEKTERTACSALSGSWWVPDTIPTASAWHWVALWPAVHYRAMRWTMAHEVINDEFSRPPFNFDDLDLS